MISHKRVKKLRIEDFNKISIEMPDDSVLTVNIAEHLVVNEDLPSDVINKMANSAPEYAYWAMVRSDLSSYKEILENEKEIFEMEIMSNERKTLGEKAAQGLVREKAILNNLEKYKSMKAKIKDAVTALEKVKMVMRAVEIQSETTRSIASSLRKEQQLFEVGSGTLKNIKKTGGK